MPIKLSERMRLILAILRVYGPQPLGDLLQIVYAGQRFFFTRQHLYLVRTLDKLEQEDLIEKTKDTALPQLILWKITEKGKNLQ